MRNRLILIEDTFAPDSWLETETDDFRQFLLEHFNGTWPDTARLYHGQVSQASDVTPQDKAGVDALAELEGVIYCVVYPAGGAVAIISLVVAIIAVVAIFMKPAIPSTALRNVQQTSPNNELSARTNTARVKGRIPDIYGTVRSTPDLIALSYSTFENNQEVENSTMCIGRGRYQINDMYDGETPISFIAGSTVEVYHPNTDIVSGLPYYLVGSPIETPPLKVTKSNSVNGQVLRAPNQNNFKGSLDIYFQYPNQIVLQTSDSNKDFTEQFSPSDDLIVSGSSFFSTGSSSTENVQPLTNSSFRFPLPVGGLPAIGVVGDSIYLGSAIFIVRTPVTDTVEAVYDLSGTYVIASLSSVNYSGTFYAVVGLVTPSDVNPQWNNVEAYDLPPLTPIVVRTIGGASSFTLDGTYSIVAVTETIITLDNPTAVNPDWANLATLPDEKTSLSSPVLQVNGSKWVGPFVLEQGDRTGLLINFVAQGGIYRDNGRQQSKYEVTVEVEVTPVNIANVPIGAPVTYSETLVGSSAVRDQVALTGRYTTALPGRCSVRVRRSSETDTTFEGSVVDEVKWRDLYGTAQFNRTNFGNVTIVRSQTYATTGALTLKERKLNCEVTRMIPAWLGGSSFTSELFPSNDAADIFSAVCLDPRIGNRSLSEVDFESIYATRNEAISYFGTPRAFEFCYTFDSDNMSFEETASSIANSVFCQAYRRGNVIKLMLERQTDDSVLLFNHRNKIPKSETRTVSFGYGEDNDGVEFEWVSPEDDAILTIAIPEDGSAVNPKKIESIGIRNGLQAHIKAWREWNKLRFSNQTVEFEATQEANLLVLQERILNADNTRPNTQDGDIVEQDGLLLLTSRDVVTTPGIAYTIFLQLSDGSVQGILVASANKREVVLTEPPRLPLVTDATNYCRTGFVLVAANSTRADAFLVTMKEPIDNYSTKITAVNYSDKYWENDKDYIDGNVDIDGKPL